LFELIHTEHTAITTNGSESDDQHEIDHAQFHTHSHQGEEIFPYHKNENHCIQDKKPDDSVIQYIKRRHYLVTVFYLKIAVKNVFRSGRIGSD
jgi:hypothetical protein